MNVQVINEEVKPLFLVYPSNTKKTLFLIVVNCLFLIYYKNHLSNKKISGSTSITSAINIKIYFAYLFYTINDFYSII